MIAAIAVYGGVAATTLAATPQHLAHDVDLEAVGTSAEKIAGMDALLQSFVDEEKVSSVVGFVAKDGQVVYHKAYGWKDVENRIPAAVDDYYVLFSQTKAIVSVAFMTLVERGLVKLDDPVAKYFPEISDQVVSAVHEDGTYETRPAASPMTFAHLLSHSSGLNAGLVGRIRRAERQQSDRPPGFGGRMPGRAPSGQHSGGGNYDAKYLKDEMLALAKYPLGFDPGTEWSYHVSTNMLGYMIERISGKPLREYVNETVSTCTTMSRYIRSFSARCTSCSRNNITTHASLNPGFCRRVFSLAMFLSTSAPIFPAASTRTRSRSAARGILSTFCEGLPSRRMTIHH